MTFPEFPTPVLPPVSQDVINAVKLQQTTDPESLYRTQLEQINSENESLLLLSIATVRGAMFGTSEMMSEEVRRQAGMAYDLVRRQISLQKPVSTDLMDHAFEAAQAGWQEEAQEEWLISEDFRRPTSVMPECSLEDSIPNLGIHYMGYLLKISEHDPLLTKAMSHGELFSPAGYRLRKAGQIGWVAMYSILDRVVACQNR